MAYKAEQGRYARMLSFWALFLLIAYGCLGELRYAMRRWFEGVGGEGAATPLVDNLPLVGALDVPFLVAAAILAAAGFVLHNLLNRPRSADLLIETEHEMRKVTWPSAGDTVNGAVAVVVTVAVMLTFLTLADSALGWIVKSLLAPGL